MPWVANKLALRGVLRSTCADAQEADQVSRSYGWDVRAEAQGQVDSSSEQTLSGKRRMRGGPSANLSEGLGA